MNTNLVPWADSHMRAAVVHATNTVLFVENHDLEDELLHQTERIYNEAQAAYRANVADDYDSVTPESLYSIFSHIELDAKVNAGRVEELFKNPRFYKVCHECGNTLTDALDELAFWHKVQAVAVVERVNCYINQLTQGETK